MNIKPEWLNLTEQQLNILFTIYELGGKNRDIKVRNIITEYENMFHSNLKRQNLFSQLKVLIQKGLIKRDNKFSYLVSTESMRDVLTKNKEIKEMEITNFNKFLKNFDNEFNSILNIPKVSYLDYQVYIETISNLINQSLVMYADSPFPNISYNHSLYRLLNREKFVDSMKLNCFKLKKLKIYYLTNLVIDLTFRRCLRVFKSEIKAYRECHNAIDRLQKQVKLFPKLDIRYMEILPGPHMYVFENDKAHNIILSLRGSNAPRGIKEIEGFHDPYGGIHIISHQITNEAKKLFLNSFNKATPLKGKKGSTLFDQTRVNLDALYQQVKK